MGLLHATAMVVGTIIGASIFVQPSEVTGNVPSVPGVLAVWLVAGLLSLVGSLVCAELASTFERSGGVYVYLRESFSPALGFLWGWAMFWVVHSGIIAAVAMVFARYATRLPGLAGVSERGLAISVIAVLTVINVLGVRYGTAVQALFTCGKLIAICLIVGFGLALGSRLPMHFEGPEAAAVTTGGFVSALVAGLFAFGGWHLVTYSSEETRDPRRTIPRALIIGVLVVTACYLALNTVYLYILPLDEVAASERVAADAAEAVAGLNGGTLLASLVVFSTFGALSGVVLAGPRLYRAMAEDGLFFRFLCPLHPRFATPHRALILQGLWSSGLVATGTYRALFVRVVYTEWIFLGLLGVSLVLLRRRGDLERDYSIWGYPVLPLGFAAVAFAIVLHQVFAEPINSALGLGLILLGLPVYFLWAGRNQEPAP